MQPLRLLVDFLRVWYDEHELKLRLGKVEPVSVSYEYLESAIQRNIAEGNLRKRIFLDELEQPLPEKFGARLRDSLLPDLTSQPEEVLWAIESLDKGNDAEALGYLDEALDQDLTPHERANLLLVRAHIRLTLGDQEKAIENYTEVIGLSGVPVEQVTKALVNRGVAHGQAGDTRRAIEDFTAVIELSRAPVEQVAQALFNRGVAHRQAGNTQRAIEDYTDVIELSGAPVEQVGQALVNRGVAHRHAGDTQRAIEDFTAVIELSGAPVEQVARALYLRGLTSSQRTRKQEDFEALIHLVDPPTEGVVGACSALADLYFREGRWSEGFQTIEAGLARGAKAQPPYHQSATDLIGVVFAAGLGPEERRSKVRDLLRLYEKHQALPVLGEAIVQNIGLIFRAGEPFPSADNLEGWVSAWEQAAEDVAEFRLSVRLLRTGIDFVKAGGKNPGALLDLTSSERAILEQAFGLA